MTTKASIVRGSVVRYRSLVKSNALCPTVPRTELAAPSMLSLGIVSFNILGYANADVVAADAEAVVYL